MFYVSIILIVCLNKGFVESILPQVSQEGLLRPYRGYADVTLFHYYVPKEVSLATFQFAAFMDSPRCPIRDVYIYVQHGSYPVMSADNATFPSKLYTKRSSMFNLTLKSAYQPHNATIFKIYYPLPGSWFAASYLPNWDQKVQQEGIGHRCQYSLGSIAIWTQVANIETIPLETTARVRTTERYSYYRFYIPSGTWEFTLKIDECKFSLSRRFVDSRTENLSSSWNVSAGTPSPDNTEFFKETNSSSPCIHRIFLQAKSLPSYSEDANNVRSSSAISDGNGSAFVHVEDLPFTDSYYYLLLESETKVSFNITITIQECPIQMLGKSFIQRFSGFGVVNTNLKDQAIRMNMTSVKSGNKNYYRENCQCSQIFRLTRIKHPQDFSDTFLLESKDWFTTWLAVNDLSPVGVSLELLPYVDIGGTLSISAKLDDLLVNATTQTVVVYGCIRKSRPSKAFCCSSGVNSTKSMTDCCESGLSIKVSSKSIDTLEDYVLIPFPEPDNWFVSFTTKCFHDGISVPCAIEEALVSLDIRTQPCILTKPTSPGGPILPCGEFGLCTEVHKGQFFYTSCRCFGGYRGWACSDDSQATPHYLLVITTLLLTVSNLFFIPAIILAIRRYMYTQALVYLCTMISSALYHLCDQEIYGVCLTRYHVLQFCDFYASILSFYVTLVSLAKCPVKYDSALYMMGAIVIAVGVEYNRTGLLVFIIPFFLGIVIPVSVWTYRSIRRGKVLKPDISSALLFVPGVLLGGAGLILFAFVETEENYRYTHSAWHVIIALSLVYLLPKASRRTKSGRENEHCNGHLETSNSAELAAVSDPSSTSSNDQNPVFFITSELDHLVQDLPTPPREVPVRSLYCSSS